MAFEKVNFDFPHEANKKPQIDVEDSGAIEVDISGKEEKKVEEPVEAKQEVEVEIIDDTPKADRNRKPSEPPEDVTEDELKKYSEQVQNRIKHFSKGYHDERRAKEAAFREKQELENLAKTLVEENKKLKGSVSKNQEALLEQAKKSATAELENAQKAYKTAYEAGDSEGVLKAQQELTKAEIKTDKLQNPWFGTDDEMTSLALGLHNKLAKQGVNLQSDEYYEAIDTRMRQLFPSQFDGGGQDVEVEKPKQKPNVVAPATRSVAPKKITLTKTQQAIAKRLGVPYELYAQKVAEEMRKENG